jgi:hypothetical protein
VFDHDDNVPADLLARWTSLDTDRAVLLDLAGFLSTCAAVLLAGVGLVGWATADIAGGTALFVFLFGLVTATLSATTRRRWQRRNHLRSRDIDLVLAHRREIRFEHWNRLVDRGEPFGSWPQEAQLAHRAEQAIRGIRAASVWQDPDLLDHRLRVDLPETARRIQVATWHLHVLRIDLGPRPSDPESAQLIPDWEIAAAHHAHSMQVLRDHVTTLEDYRTAVGTLNDTIAGQRRAAHLRRLTDGAVRRLTEQDAHHELATEHLAGLWSELQPSRGTRPPADPG